jgi:hypothetical protein
MRSLTVRVGAAVLALFMAVSTVACDTSWVDKSLEIVAAVTPAITNIVPLIALADKDVSPADITSIQTLSGQASAALQTTGSLIDQFNKATSDAAKQDLLSKIEAALVVAQNNLNTILSQLHIGNPRTKAIVAASLGAIISEVGSLAALVPVLKAGKTAQAVALAKPITARQFRARYNSAIKPIPGSGKLKLKGESWFSSLGNAVGEAFVSR